MLKHPPFFVQVGNGILTLNEQRTQMSLWALFKSPLMVSADLQRIPPQSLDLLTNHEVLAVNQDPSTRPGDLVFQDGPYQVWQGWHLMTFHGRLQRQRFCLTSLEWLKQSLDS